MDPTFLAFLTLLNSIPVLGPLLPYIPLVCGLAVIVDAAIPPPPEGSPWIRPRQVVHVLAGNFGYARNAIPAGGVPATVAQKAAEVRDVAASIEQAAGELAQRADGQPEAAKAVLTRGVGALRTGER